MHVNLNGRTVGSDHPTYIIAEIGMNHNGEVELAAKMIEAAAEAGADAVKFQTFHTERFLSPDIPNRSERKRYELTADAHARLRQVARDQGVDFISTPLDPTSVDLLDTLDVPCFKIASCDVTNLPLLTYIGSKGRPVILSTGYATLGEIDEALSALERSGIESIILLHCVSEYPTPPERANLRAISTLRTTFQRPVGLSDHSLDPCLIPSAAVALGACVIEKHFTLDRSLPGYDHHMSATPEDFRAMVSHIRTVESALGTGAKEPTEAEMERRTTARRSLYWARPLTQGSPVEPDAVAVLRPGRGVCPSMLPQVLKARTRVAVVEGEPVKLSQLLWDEDR